jgi:hypothetical protein
MGWYLRKSFALGPLRINLSKSGIGASAGVKELRVSTGPKGRQLNAGREGLYYRASLKSPRKPPRTDPKSVDPIAETANENSAKEWSSQAHAAATAVGFQLGNQLLRGILRGLFKRR